MKLVPVIVTLVPTLPNVGAKEVIVGGADGPIFRRTETVLVPSFAMTKSGSPSPSRSPVLMNSRAPLSVRSFLVANEILPLVLVLRNTEHR